MKVKIRKPYDDHARSSVTFSETTMAKQSFQAECDINTIMSKYQNDGVIQHVQKVQGAYGDFSNVADYQLHLNQVIAAQEAFDDLPSKIRERFGNDPAHLMTFISDEKNRDEAVKLGLIEPDAPAPAPTRVEIVNPPQPRGPEARQEAPGGEPTPRVWAQPIPPNSSP